MSEPLKLSVPIIEGAPELQLMAALDYLCGHFIAIPIPKVCEINAVSRTEVERAVKWLAEKWMKP